jgi:hypothetical protein
VKDRDIVDLSAASTGMCWVDGCSLQGLPYGLKSHSGEVRACGAHAFDAVVEWVSNGLIVLKQV